MHIAFSGCGSKFFTQTPVNFYPNTCKLLHAKFYTLKPNMSYIARGTNKELNAYATVAHSTDKKLNTDAPRMH